MLQPMPPKDAVFPGQRPSGCLTAPPEEVSPRPAAAVAAHPREAGGPWHSGAACRRDEAALFFAPSKEPTAARLAREEAAKRVCARCPVLMECREHALLQPEPYGVWGGLTAAERRVLLARRRRRDAELKPAAAHRPRIAAVG